MSWHLMAPRLPFWFGELSHTALSIDTELIQTSNSVCDGLRRSQDAELEQVFGWYFATKEYLHCDALAAAPYHCRHSHGQVQTIPNHTFYILTV